MVALWLLPWLLPDEVDMKLSKTLIDSLAYNGNGKSAQVHWDERIPGFGVRVMPSGTKVFVLKYRYRGKQRWFSIGRYGALTLHQALKAAQDRYLEVKIGKDPKTESERQRFATKTVSDLVDYFMENHAKTKTKSWKQTDSIMEKYVKPNLGHMLVRNVKREDIARLHVTIGANSQSQANRVLAWLSKMFNEAIVWGFLPEDAVNPASRIKRYREVSRDRFASRDELPRIIKAINARDVFIQGLIWLYLLTGLRKTELLSLKWGDVDLENARIRIGMTKNGKPHYLPLASVSVRKLESLPRYKGNPYVFPGRKEGSHRVDIQHVWEDICEEAEAKDLHIHDLRRTVGSYLAQEGKSLALIGQILNHSDAKTTQIYARFNNEPVRKALEEHAQLLEGIVEAEA